MFTLAALVGRAETAPSSQEPRGPGKREGSGVIDLNALAKAAEERARHVHSEPPPAAFAREARLVDEAPPTMSRRIRFAGIGAAAVVLAIVGVAVAASGSEEPKQPARATAATQLVDVTPTLAPEPTSTATSPSDDKATVAKGSAKGHKGGWHAHANVSGQKLTKVTSPGTSPGTSPPPPPKPPAGSDPCGCKGNLQCAIKCFK
jgi:hypothetical protein